MENNLTILNELKALSPLLAEQRPGHPYSVPAGYFSQFPIRMAEKAASPLPSKMDVPMDVPAGYFNNLAADILKKIKTQETLSEKEVHSELLEKAGKKMPYSVPEGYFESLDAHLQKKVGLHRDLKAAQTKNPYTVPEGYFEGFPARMLSRVNLGTEKARLFSIGFARKVYRYAAAAILVGVVSVAALMYFRNQPAGTASVDMNSVSLDELQNYVTGQELLQPENSIIATNGDLKADDLKEFLNDMPEETLQQYVQEYAQPNIN